MRPNVDVATRGTVEAMKLRALSLVFLANRSSLSMNASFRSFVVGLGLSVPLLCLILVAQFRSFLDPFIILLALPPRHFGCHSDAACNGYDDERYVADGRHRAGIAMS
jgi:multidrug efflux pump subunit AcrB